jgi:ribosomal protein L37AE/L43A
MQNELCRYCGSDKEVYLTENQIWVCTECYSKVQLKLMENEKRRQDNAKNNTKQKNLWHNR